MAFWKYLSLCAQLWIIFSKGKSIQVHLNVIDKLLFLNKWSYWTLNCTGTRWRQDFLNNGRDVPPVSFCWVWISLCLLALFGMEFPSGSYLKKIYSEKTQEKWGRAQFFPLYCVRWQSIHTDYLSIPLFRIYSPSLLTPRTLSSFQHPLFCPKLATSVTIVMQTPAYYPCLCCVRLPFSHFIK